MFNLSIVSLLAILNIISGVFGDDTEFETKYGKIKGKFKILDKKI